MLSRFSHVQLSVTLWTMACQAPLSMGFSRQEYWSRLSFPSGKECSNYRTIALISLASKVILKILQARLQQYLNQELKSVQTGFRKGRGTRDQIANIRWIIEKTREFQEYIYFCFIDYTKAFDCGDHNKLWKILREGNIRSPYLPPAKPVCRSRSKLQPDMEQRTSSKLGKEYIKAEYCHHAYLTYMQRTS